MNKLDLITVETERSQPDELDNRKKVYYLNDGVITEDKEVEQKI